MSNALTAFQGGALSNVFAGEDFEDLSAGVQTGFGVVSIRGKTFSVRYGGETQHVPDPNNPRVEARELDVVIVLGNQNLSKNYYIDGYSSGDDAPPDCYSVHGVKPEPDSPHLQNDTCLTCKWNRFGSRMGQDGKQGKGKACQDNRRLAIVPLADMDNEVWGGPMLLRVPPTSLASLAAMQRKLNEIGHRYFSVATRLSFERVEYPQLVFTPIAALTDEQAAKVVALRKDGRAERIINAGATDLGDMPTAPAKAPGPALGPPSKVIRDAEAEPMRLPPTPPPVVSTEQAAQAFPEKAEAIRKAPVGATVDVTRNPPGTPQVVKPGPRVVQAQPVRGPTVATPEAAKPEEAVGDVLSGLDKLFES